MIVTVPAEHRHCEELVQLMRQEDVDECIDIYGRQPLECALSSLENSVEASAVYIQGDLCAVYGVNQDTVLCSDGVVWMMATKNTTRHRLAFSRFAKRELSQINQRIHILWNLTDPKYEMAYRWMQWLGFRPGPWIDVDGKVLRYVCRMEVH